MTTCVSQHPHLRIGEFYWRRSFTAGMPLLTATVLVLLKTNLQQLKNANINTVEKVAERLTPTHTKCI